MFPMPNYCEIAHSDPYHRKYHDTEYGFPVVMESILFERLSLEIFQAGLSWLLVLKKRQNFQRAFDGFNVNLISKYGHSDILRLKKDSSIIRNQLKIEATIYNAKSFLEIRKTHGSVATWLEYLHPLSKKSWVKIFRKHFKFIGDEIVGEFLLSTGYLPGAHHQSCPTYSKIIALDPPWSKTKF